MPVKVILNPCAGHGYGRKAAPKIESYLRELGVPFEMELTSRPCEAIGMAEKAVRDGFDMIVAVGGDGTTHEVINGVMQSNQEGQEVLLGCIPTGSGNDFAVMNGVPPNVRQACELIAHPTTRIVDVGRVRLDDVIERYFDNTVGIGFDGLVVKETKRMKRLRGLFLYLPAVLKTVFVTLTAPHVRIVSDGVEERLRALMIVVCNGPREGGGFLLSPEAKQDDGLLDIVIARPVSKLGILALIPRFMKGTHLSHPLISLKHARHLVIESEETLHVHVDGEILSNEVHKVEIEILPKHLKIVAPQAFESAKER